MTIDVIQILKILKSVPTFDEDVPVAAFGFPLDCSLGALYMSKDLWYGAYSDYDVYICCTLHNRIGEY